MESATAALTVPLDQCGTAPISLVGSKAHHLGKAIAAGLPVPQGVVLTAAAFARWSPRLLDGTHGSIPMSGELAEELSAIRDEQGAIEMATRLDPELPEVRAAAEAGREILTGLRARPFLDRLEAAMARTSTAVSATPDHLAHQLRH